MDQRGGGCCIARYAGGGGAYDVSKMDRIMLRFRPIAPKPAAPSCDGTAAPPVNTSPVKTKRGRGTKRCVNERKNNNNNKKKCMRTLALLPEAPHVKEPQPPPKKQRPVWLSFENGGGVVSRKRAAVGSWVRVECVTDAWFDVGRTDEERVRNLGVDTCPAFISDVLNKVTWTNAAYKQMVLGAAGEVAAWVVVNDGVVLPVGCAAFTCRVRVVTCQKETSSTTVPCDVWKLDCGGFAWRLDTAAALSL